MRDTKRPSYREGGARGKGELLGREKRKGDGRGALILPKAPRKERVRKREKGVPKRVTDDDPAPKMMLPLA